MSIKAQFQSFSNIGGCIVQISGQINENLDPQELLANVLSDVVVFDLDQIESITSFGVKQWMSALESLQAKYYAYIHCRPSVITQFNTVANFASKGQLISFYAPYFCKTCQKEFEILIDLRKEHDILFSKEPPQKQCVVCQEVLEFSDFPESYFFYIAQSPLPIVPRIVDNLIDGERNVQKRLPPPVPSPKTFRIQKEIEGSVTGLRLQGSLTRQSQFRRTLDGLEGYIVVLLSNVNEVTQEGLIGLKEFLSKKPLYLARVPSALLKTLRILPPKELQVQIVSFWLSTSCQVCHLTLEMEVGFPFSDPLLSEYDLSCSSCQTPNRLLLQVPQNLQSLFASSLPATVKEYLQKRPGQEPEILKEKYALLSSTRDVMRYCVRCQEAYNPDVQECPVDLVSTVPLLPSLTSDLYLGEFITNFQVTKKLGEGGMGSVYLAQDPSSGKKSAVKFLRPNYAQKENLVARFLVEAKASTQIASEHIVDIQDFGKLNNQHPYILMEFLKGETLRDLLQHIYNLTPKVSLSIVQQLLSALESAHSRGIVHRDLKPDNIFLLPQENKGFFVKLLDFGIAKLLDVETPITLGGVVLGTPHYMSPEQAEGKSSQIDRRSDLYSVGVILFRLLCGRLPFLAESNPQVMLAHVSKNPPLPRSLNPLLSLDFEQFLLKALEKSSKDRFQTAKKMAQAITISQKTLSEKAIATPPSPAKFSGMAIPDSSEEAFATTQTSSEPEILVLEEEAILQHTPSSSEENAAIVSSDTLKKQKDTSSSE